ncbi:MAG: ABC-2 type transport system ATP-binding protein [Saprospiraceae bacterium]|jgi:ABC-2 type transport system ATP-binding protein
MSILSLRNVVKNYHNHTAVDNVSFDVPKGSVFGLLGPNGAGKTSLIRIITTITMADSGQVLLDGEPINFNHPSQIGYMPEERGLYKKMKVGEQLLYLAQLKGMPYKEAKQKLHSWLDKFDIISWWDKRVEELSKGMQQKIQFIATVVHEPKLLILDEPFSGLDPINTNLIKDEIDQLNQNGTSIIFSTHRMEQVEEVCENIILINNGRKILEGNVSQIKIDHKENLFKVEFDNSLLRINGLANFQILESQNDSITVKLNDGMRPNDLLGLLIGNGAEINSFNEILPSINDIFISRVGKSKE